MELAGIISAWVIVSLIFLAIIFVLSGVKQQGGHLGSNFVISIVMLSLEFLVWYQVFMKSWMECPTICLVTAIATTIEHSLVAKIKLLKKSD